MKINSSSINFQAGFTSKMQGEIAAVDVKKISREFINNGIEADFKENKIIAWCALQCLNIIKLMNKKYGLKLGLPKGVFVEDFSKLKIKDKSSTGFLNMVPTNIYMNNDKIVPEKTIFFNEFKEFNNSEGNEFWYRIDKMADENFEKNFSATDFFLEPVLHEFLHVVHEENLIHKLGAKKLMKLFEKTLNPYQLDIFRAKHSRMLEKICTYASESPYEAVACDLSKRTIANLDKNTLTPRNNFMLQSPYKKQSFIENWIINKPEPKLTQTLRSFWNGKME